MGIINTAWRRFTGTANKDASHITWSDETVKYTSAYMASVILFIAREFSKLNIDHRVYTKQDNGKYFTSNKLGSNIYETLNFAPNGYKNNTEFKRDIMRRLTSGATVYLKPSYKNGVLVSLNFTDGDYYERHKDDTVVITSPYHVSQNATLYDQILTTIGSQLSDNKLRGFLKVGATIDSRNVSFKDAAMKQLELLQDVAKYNGLGILDNKADVIELQKEYQTLDAESVTIIKREILNGFGFTERLLTGEYNDEDYKHFFDNVLAPVIREMETELTYKLLTTNARINNGEKKTFERIVISVDVFKFAGVDQLIKLAAANTNGAYLMVNEVRHLFGRDPIEGGDVFRTNLNSTEVKYDDDNA